MVTKKDVKFEKPRSQVVAEALAKQDPPEKLHTFVDPKDSDTIKDGFVGVDPIYQNAANEFDEPIAAKSGVDKKAEEAFKEAMDNEPKEAGTQLSDLYVDRARPSLNPTASVAEESDSEGDGEDEEPGSDSSSSAGDKTAGSDSKL